MDTISKGWAKDLITRLFIKSSHHKGVSTIVVLQNAFENSLRTVNRNSQYLVMFDQAGMMTLCLMCHFQFLKPTLSLNSWRKSYFKLTHHPTNRETLYRSFMVKSWTGRFLTRNLSFWKDTDLCLPGLCIRLGELFKKLIAFIRNIKLLFLTFRYD